MPRYGRDAPLECKVYVGDLARDVSEKELEKAFSCYGSLKSVWVARNPPGFAFVEFDDVRDADDAVRGMDGTSLSGSRIRVEQSTGKSGPKPWTSSGRRSRERDVGGRGGPPRPRKPYDPNDRCYECGGRGHYAYDCQRYGGGNAHRSRSRSVDRRKDRSRSHSRGRYYRSRSRSRSRDRYKGRSRSQSRSPPPRDRHRSRSRSVSRPRYR